MNPTGKTIVEYREGWDLLFRAEAERLSKIFPSVIIHHIGSTAVPGIVAKPILDMLGIVQALAEIDQRERDFIELGYEVLGENGIGGRRYFRKADQGGVRTHHLHVYEIGSRHIDRHLAFRDYLLTHPVVAREYSDLKTKLSALSPPEYQSAKYELVAQIEADALAWQASQRRSRRLRKCLNL